MTSYCKSLVDFYGLDPVLNFNETDRDTQHTDHFILPEKSQFVKTSGGSDEITNFCYCSHDTIYFWVVSQWFFIIMQSCYILLNWSTNAWIFDTNTV